MVLVVLMTFKIIKRFFAIIALVECFTCCRSELTYQPGMPRLASGALNRFVFLEKFNAANRMRRIRRCNAKSFQFLFACFCYPVGCPCRTQGGSDLYVSDSTFYQCLFYV